MLSCRAALRFALLTASLALTLAGLFAQQPAAPGTWRLVGNMKDTRYGHTAVKLLNQSVLVTGGFGSCQVAPGYGCAASELYNPITSRWTPTGSMGKDRVYHTTTLLADGKVLAAAGFTDLSELYNPATGTWSPTGSMGISRWLHAAVRLGDGRVLASGGIVGDPGVTSPTAELYNPATGTWSPAQPMKVARSGHRLTLLPDGRVLATGSGSILAEVYNPATGAWSLLSPMKAARYGESVTLLPNGKVLIAGGSDRSGFNFLNSAELFDPISNTFDFTGSMAGARGSHIAAALSTGKVLTAGGVNLCQFDVGCFTTNTAELYDPSTGLWAPASPMLIGRSDAASAVLPGGRVLVHGGIYQQGWFESAILKNSTVYVP